jgi:lysophospholipase L1-like esterase
MALLLVPAGLLLVAAEVWFRVEYSRYEWLPPVASEYDSYPYTDPQQHPRTYRQLPHMSYDSFLGYLPTPNLSGLGYHTNGQSFRYDDELPESKDADEIRIFVTGGSMAWGAGVRQDQTYAALLESFLGAHPDLRGYHVRVIPAGVGAYVTTQERILTLSRILEYDPDVLVMFTGSNDVYEGYRGNRLLRHQDFMEIRRALEKSPVSRVSPGLDASAMASVDRPSWRDYRSKLHYRIALALYRLRTRDRVDEFASTLSFPYEQTASETLRNVHAIVDATRRHDIDFLLYFQPFLPATNKVLSDWEREILENDARSMPGWHAFVEGAYEYYRQHLAQDARDEGYRFVDADAAIASESEALFIDEYHLGDRGNRLVAEHLLEHLLPTVVARARQR